MIRIIFEVFSILVSIWYITWIVLQGMGKF